MATAQETAAKLVEGTDAVVRGDTAYKADVAAAIIDLLLGSDPQALVRGIPGIPPTLFEVISDGIVAAMREQIMRRLTAPPLPASAPTTGVAKP